MEEHSTKEYEVIIEKYPAGYILNWRKDCLYLIRYTIPSGQIYNINSKH